MSIVNRRNAVIGWATWTVIKQMLRRNAKAEAASEKEPKPSWRERRRADEVAAAEAEARQRRKSRRLVGFLIATGIGVGIWAKTRGGRTPDVE